MHSRAFPIYEQNAIDFMLCSHPRVGLDGFFAARLVQS